MVGGERDKEIRRGTEYTFAICMGCSHLAVRGRKENKASPGNEDAARVNSGLLVYYGVVVGRRRDAATAAAATAATAVWNR
jgi:hypothetical protein